MACSEGVAGAVIGRNAGIGFNYFTLNPRLSRSFALTQRVQLEGIAEAFNSLNHRNDMVPTGTFGAGAYPATPGFTFGGRRSEKRSTGSPIHLFNATEPIVPCIHRDPR